MTTKAEPKKTFKTFRDLKTISKSPHDEPLTSTSTPSISSKTGIPSISSNTSTTSTPKKSSFPNKIQNKETSPVRDFQKIPNSVTRDALPQGTFKGKSKHVYDYLWSVSRGAIQPTRFVKKSRREIKKGSGLGSMVTVDAAIEHLQLIGLLKVTQAVGSLSGNEYEIFAPDEIDLSSPSISSISSKTSLTQKVDILANPESSISRETQTVESKDGYNDVKTIFKTLNQEDDESPLAEILKMLNEAAKRATGKDLTAKDFEALKDIVEIIISETDLARTRTHSISVYLKLAAENLRRRLYSKKTEIKIKNVPEEKNWIEVGKNTEQIDEYDEQGNYIPKPLDENDRKEALKILREYQSWDAPVEDSGRFYTPEDWEWLMKNLPKQPDEEKD